MSQQKTYTFLNYLENVSIPFTHLFPRARIVACSACWSGAGQEAAKVGKGQTRDL